MPLDLHSGLILPPDRQVLVELEWGEVADLWNRNQLGQLHDWLNARWARLIRNRPLGEADPEAAFLQGLAFAVLALFFTQNRNQEGALLLLDDALLALNRYRPGYLGVELTPILATLEELRPLLIGLPPDAPCPRSPFVYPPFEHQHASP